MRTLILIFIIFYGSSVYAQEDNGIPEEFIQNILTISKARHLFCYQNVYLGCHQFFIRNINATERKLEIIQDMCSEYITISNVSDEQYLDCDDKWNNILDDFILIEE